MPLVPVERVRNIGIIAHIDAGKTTTTERFLFYAGKTHRLGEVHDGRAIMDYRPDERERGITITAAATTLLWGDYQINLIDTPGHVDFTAEVERALRVLDGAVVILDAVEGVEPQSETVWHQADRYRVPRLVFVNKMDRLGADFDASVASLRERLRATPVPIQFPEGSGESFGGVVDLIRMRLLRFDPESQGRRIEEADVPEALQDEAARRRQLMVEQVAELDDTVAELYLSDQPVPEDILHQALRRLTLARSAVPVLCGAALRNTGIQPLLDAVCRYLPAPRDLPPVVGEHPETGEALERPADPAAPFTALVFKVVATQAADLYYLRVYSGTAEAGARVWNPRTREQERLRRLLLMHADRGEPLKEVEAGDIVAVPSLHRSATGDTLCDPAEPILLEPIRFPDTVVAMAVEPRSSADRDRLAEVLARIEREDPTFRVRTDPETGQTLISGMGELHLEVVLNRIRRDFGLEVKAGNPRVSYRETVSRAARGEGEYRRQVGGEWLYGRVVLEVEPLDRPDAPVEVQNDLPEGVLPPPLAQAVLDAARNAAEGGGAYGYPVTGIRIRLVEAAYEEAGQPEIALSTAASLAFREAVREAGAVVLEPYGRLEVRAPETFLGAVVRSLNQRRAVVEDTGFHRGNVVVKGVAPIAEMFGYLTDLRSLTQGRGSFSLEPLDYRPVPEPLAAAQHHRLYD